MARRFWLSALIIGCTLLIHPQKSSAQQLATDKCADVLKDGVFDKTAIDESHYNRQILWSRMKRMDWKSVQNEKDFGANYKDVFGATFSEDRYEAFKRSLEVSTFSDVEDQYVGAYRLMTANKDILNAWEGCMASRGGGVQVWFTPVSTTRAEIHVRYVPALQPRAATTTRTTAQATLTSGSAVSDQNGCLTYKKTLNAGDCIAVVEAVSPDTAVHVVIHTDMGDVSAFLPPRVEYRLKAGEPYPPNLANKFSYSFDWHGAYWKVYEKNLHIDESLQSQGWVFDPAATAPKSAELAGGSGSCETSKITAVQPYDIYTTQKIIASNTKTSVTCRYGIVPRLQRIEKVAAVK